MDKSYLVTNQRLGPPLLGYIVESLQADSPQITPAHNWTLIYPKWKLDRVAKIHVPAGTRLISYEDYIDLCDNTATLEQYKENVPLYEYVYLPMQDLIAVDTISKVMYTNA